MVSIGAQSNGNPVGENATLLSNLYMGTTDRIIEQKQDFSGINTKSLKNRSLISPHKKKPVGLY